MARIHHVKRAQQRYRMVPVLDPETGEPKVTPVMRRNGSPKRTKRGREVTRRVTQADKTQPLAPYRCGHCAKDIETGSAYKWVQIKSGPYGGRTLRRHESCPTWRPSELTTSKMAGIYAAQENLSDGLDAAEVTSDAEALRDEFAEAVREVASEYEESADNMEEGFGHATSMSDELREKGDALNEWADEVESTDVPDAPDEDDWDGLDEDAEDDDWETRGLDYPTHDEALDAWREEVRDALAVTDDIPI